MVRRIENKEANRYLRDSELDEHKVETIIKNYIYNKSIRVIADRADVSPSTVQEKIKLIDKRIDELDLLNEKVIQCGSAGSKYVPSRKLFWSFKKRHCTLTNKRLEKKRYILSPKPNARNMLKCNDVKFQSTAAIIATTVALKHAYVEVPDKKIPPLNTAHYEAGIIFTNGLRVSGLLNDDLDMMNYHRARERMYKGFVRRFCLRTPVEAWSIKAEELYKEIAYNVDGKPNKHADVYNQKTKKRYGKIKA